MLFAVGIAEGLVRYTTGIEDLNDLIADIEQALSLPSIGI